MYRTMMQIYVKGSDTAVKLYQKAYGILKDGAKIIYPLSPCEYSVLMVDLIDKYGVRWCIFV